MFKCGQSEKLSQSLQQDAESEKSGLRARKHQGGEQDMGILGEGYIKGKTIHRTKRTAEEFAASYRADGVRCRIIKLAKGYRVDRRF
jgi:hypothetical protein